MVHEQKDFERRRFNKIGIVSDFIDIHIIHRENE